MVAFNKSQKFSLIYKNKPDLLRTIQLVKETKDYYLAVEDGCIKKFLKNRILYIRGLPTDIYPAEPIYKGYPFSVSIKRLEEKLDKIKKMIK